MFDLDAYLQRIGLSGRPSVADVHRAHCTSIPFESLDPQMGLPVSLELDDIFGKLVLSRRGGYCFEQNLLLAAALQALGVGVEMYLARVLFGSQPGVLRARTHLLLKLQARGEESLLADVGFGSGTLLEPLPWGPAAEAEHEQAGWRFRIVERAGEHVLQTAVAADEGGWVDLYAFMPLSVPAVELESANWWTSTHPSSRFVNGFLVSRQWADGRRLVMSDWGELCLTERTASSETVTPLSRAQIPALLAERFQLPGFALAADGRLTRA